MKTTICHPIHPAVRSRACHCETGDCGYASDPSATPINSNPLLGILNRWRGFVGKLSVLPLLTAALAGFACNASATLSTVADYAFENNASPAGFTVIGSPSYSGGQLVLNGGSCLAIATPVTATDNFGIEIICTPSVNDAFNFSVALNDGANNGWGLVQISEANQGIAEGAATFGNAGAATIGTPVRLALVRAGGVATVYRNGVAVGTTYGGTRAIPTTLTIGASKKNATTYEGYFKGSIDQVRAFTFAPGQFNPATDLLTEPTLVPAVPIGLAATPANTTVVLGWTVTTGATGYHVKRSMTSGTGYAPLATVTAATYTDTAVANGTPYYYTISAFNNAGESQDSAEVSATPAPIKLDQSITFSLGLNLSKTTVDPTFADLATATSALPVAYSSDNESVANVNAAGTVTITGLGTAHILANQAGDVGYNPAPQVSQTLVVSKGTPVISWASPADIVVGMALDDLQLNATTTVPGAFAYTPASGSELPLGTSVLSVQFTPDNAALYNTPAVKTVSLNVLPRNSNLHEYTFNDDQIPAGFSVVGAGTPTYRGGQLVLDGTSALTIAAPLSATDNFAIEIICTPAANDAFNFSVALNNGANNGWGLLQIAGINQGIAESAGPFGQAGAATLGTPVRLALVRAGGVTTVYKNGVAQPNTTTALRATPTTLTIGANQGTTTPTFEGWFRGTIDEVRLFTFFPGEFDPATDLLGEPTQPPRVVKTWNNSTTNGEWNITDANWSGALWQNTPPDDAVFGASGAGTVTLTDALTARSVTFDHAGYSLTGGSLTLTDSVTTHADAIIDSSIDTGFLTKMGDATLTLTGLNTYQGFTAIEKGTLTLGNYGLLGNGSYAGQLFNEGAFIFASSVDQTFSGAISGSGSLDKSGSGTLTLSGGGLGWYGDTTVSNGTLILAKQSLTSASSWSNANIEIKDTATLQFGSHDNFGSASTTFSPAIVIHSGGTLDSGGWFNTLWDLNLNGGTLTANGGDSNWGSIGLTGTVTVDGPAPSTIDVGANPTNARIDLRTVGTTFEVADVTHDGNPDLTISAVISNGPPGSMLWNVGSLIKGGPGTLLLTATSTYSGGTVIDAGTLQLGDGTVDHDGSLGGGGITNHADLVYNLGNDQIVNYVIAGNGKLTKAGINTLTLTQDEIYTGNVAVAGGTLVLWYPSLGASSAVTVAPGAVMDLDFVGSNGIAALVLGGTNVPIGTYNSLHPIYGSFFAGAGSLEVTDYGRWAVANGVNGGPDADDDNDGVDNQTEYAFGLLPTEGSSINPIVVALDRSTGTFSYTRRDPTLTQLTYSVWTSSDLATWNEAKGALGSAGSVNENGVQTVVVTLATLPTAPAFFIQMRAN